jgi:hypothetical protein
MIFILAFFRPPDKRWKIGIEWGPSDPFHHDVWIVRWALSGGGPPSADLDVLWSQLDLHNYSSGMGPAHVSWEFQNNDATASTNPDDGWNLWFVVEGCDNPGNALCHQGWSPMMAARYFARPE